MTVETRRELRKGLLELFDKYKVNVLYGIVEETDEERVTMLAWYHALLNLEDDDGLYLNPPAKIVYYAAARLPGGGGAE